MRRAVDRQPPERDSSAQADPGGDACRGHAAVDSRPRHRRAASRSGCRIAAAASIDVLDTNLQKFLAEARKRPGAGRRRLAVQRRGAAGLRRRRSRQGAQGRASRSTDVYQTLQTFLGGLYVNQFNRFGRQWRVFLQAEGRGAQQPGQHRPVLRAQQRRQHGAAVVAAVDAADLRSGVHQALQRLSRRAGDRRGGAGLQLGPGARRARGGGQGDAAADDRLRLVGSVVSGAQGLGQRARGSSRCRWCSCS